MKKRIWEVVCGIVVVLLFLCVFVVSCKNNLVLLLGQNDRNAGERPSDFIPSRWESDVPSIWFDVQAVETDPEELSSFEVERFYLEHYQESIGEIIVGDSVIPIRVDFNPPHDTIYLFEIGSEYKLLVIGECKFSSEKFIMKITEDRSGLFNGKYEEIVFVRTA